MVSSGASGVTMKGGEDDVLSGDTGGVNSKGVEDCVVSRISKVERLGDSPTLATGALVSEGSSVKMLAVVVPGVILIDGRFVV
jgi:hypothetical protein